MRPVAAIPIAVSPLGSSELVVNWPRGRDLALGNPLQGTSRPGSAFEGLAAAVAAPPFDFCEMGLSMTDEVRTGRIAAMLVNHSRGRKTAQKRGR